MSTGILFLGTEFGNKLSPFLFFILDGGIEAMIATKKALQKQIKQLKQDNEQFRLITQYLLFDVEATKREKDGAMAQVILLREELAKLKQKLQDEGLIE